MLDPKSQNSPPSVVPALKFAQALLAGQYAVAHAMLASGLRSELSIAQLKQRVEETLATCDPRPTKATVLTAGFLDQFEDDPNDLGWALISIPSQNCRQSLNFTVHLMKHKKPVIRYINWSGGFGIGRSLQAE